MKRATFSLSTLGLVATLAACGTAPAPESGAAESAWETNDWQQTLVCNGGVAVLDVDKGERRHLQFVIRDANAINYVTGKVGMQMLLNRGNGRELIATGWSNNGVFGAADFSSLAADATDYRWRTRVNREGRGIRVTFEMHERQGGYCTDWCSETCCGGYAGQTDAYPELANWYFDDCR